MKLLVSLWLAPGASEAAFEDFERGAARLMARHGGRILSAYRPVNRAEGAPFEVHVVEFDSRDGLASYQADPDVLARSAHRAALIARTEVSEVAEFFDY